MWTRIYLLLVVVRLYFALSPSYLHPDENFQGPEVVVGESLSLFSHISREFGLFLPMRIIRVLQWHGDRKGGERLSPLELLRASSFYLLFRSAGLRQSSTQLASHHPSCSHCHCKYTLFYIATSKHTHDADSSTTHHQAESSTSPTS